VYDPQGRPVAKGPDEGEAVVVATLDPVELARVSDTHTMLRDRPGGPGRDRRTLRAGKSLASPAPAGQADPVV
jgi:hypothetical protein